VRVRSLLSQTLFVVLSACGGDNSSFECLPEPERACDASFAPTFEAFYANHLATCASSPVCHGYGAESGLVLAGGPDAAYDALLGRVEGPAFVLPGDPNCSILIQRLESTDTDFVMPRGMALPDEAQCAVRQWVENGATRD
jgi:hypothetical protein